MRSCSNQRHCPLFPTYNIDTMHKQAALAAIRNLHKLYDAVKCSAMPRYRPKKKSMLSAAVQCHALQSSATQCSAVQRNVGQCSAMQCSTMQCVAQCDLSTV